jgi:serine/threonine protein kinase
MTYCFNPACENPQNPEVVEFCLACNSALWLRNRYRVIQVIEEGNFGRTLLGEDADRLRDRCVIKQLFKWRKVQDQAEAMAKVSRAFEQEAALLLQLGTHPQIPTLLACFEQDRRFYIVQEYIQGQNLLEELLEQGVFSEQKIRDLLNDLLPVLKFIHAHNVIHRDIKPMNIIRRQSDGKLVLIDFGLAKQLQPTACGKTGSRYGTEGYAPIEQTRGKVYPASDLYSLGITCIQLLAGAALEELYDAEQGIWIWREYLRNKATDVSDDLGQILDKLIKDSLKERYQSADIVIKDLEEGVPKWRCVHTFSGIGKIEQVTFSPDGETIASSSDDKTLKVWHLSSRQLVQSVRYESQAVKFAVISADGKTLASGTGDSKISIWNTVTGQLLHTLDAGAGAVHQVAFSPDGETLVSGNFDSTVKLWHPGTGKLLDTIRGHSGAVFAVALSPDGKILASGGADKKIRIWHLGSGVLLHVLTQHSAAVNALCISPDGEMLISGSADCQIVVWHPGSGKLMDILWGHQAPVRSVAFSPDGHAIASGSDDRTIKLWRRAG